MPLATPLKHPKLELDRVTSRMAVAPRVVLTAHSEPDACSESVIGPGNSLMDPDFPVSVKLVNGQAPTNVVPALLTVADAG